MKIKLTIILLIVFAGQCWSYHSLRVGDPQTWYTRQGTIEAAALSIRPQGNFMEYGLYLTFSAAGWNYDNHDTLEVVLHFELPEEAIIHDSWLWVGNDIIRAELLDRWSASQIYEDIVDRRQDPSILYKNNATDYELRIFPMAGDETRRVKLSYLMPTSWTQHAVRAELPTRILETSRYNVENFPLMVFANTEWANPQIPELPELEFSSMTDSTFGGYQYLDHTDHNTGRSISFDAPLNNGVYLNHYSSENESIYQLAILPGDLVSTVTQEKTAFLIDYHDWNTYETAEEVMLATRAGLLANASSSDSFNLFLSDLNIVSAGDTWLPMDSTTIEDVFTSLESYTLSGFSNLPLLLETGIEFIAENGHDGQIVLMSPADQVGDPVSANALIDDLLGLMDPAIRISIGNYQETGWDHYWIGGQGFWGNEYFFINLSNLTGGYYEELAWDQNYLSLFNSVLYQSGGIISAFDLYTTLASGYCYGRFTQSSTATSAALNQAILQTGKYYGEPPFVIEFSGLYQGELISQQFTITEDEMFTADSFAEEIWAGTAVNHMERADQTNAVITEILNQSLNERVLSEYTAFLCLEPAQGGVICDDCLDETTLITSVDDVNVPESDSLSVMAYPNPFNAATSIRINYSTGFDHSSASYKIYDLRGRVIRSFELEASAVLARTISWNGDDNQGHPVASGHYIFVVSSSSERQIHKLMLLK